MEQKEWHKENRTEKTKETECAAFLVLNPSGSVLFIAIYGV